MSKSGSTDRENASARATSRSSSAPGLEKLKTGAQVTVGNHKVEVIQYLAEGGFAHIYIVKFLEVVNELEYTSATSLKPGDLACLKRVFVVDENGLNEMRNEVNVMKKLANAQNIVHYYDSHASRAREGPQGFEVLLLMELCPNNSLLDYMNQRLATKLSESEILKIMFDITRAVAEMHYLSTPLIHRDIKIENVLVDSQHNFKLCDFGSTSQCFPVATTHREIAMLTNNIYVHTTPQYRSPEMIDLYRCLPINEKSDIWALGIFLYKLLFYTTPFELTGQFAILHSKYEFPSNNYSSKIINLIIIMLSENPNLRPNIYQTLYHLCSILKVDIPLEDKYNMGPYDFERYSKYQEKLQRIQYQMFASNDANQAASISDDFFINCFEVAPKQPAFMGQSSSSVTDTTSSMPSQRKDEVGGGSVESGGEEDITVVQQQFPSVEDLESYLRPNDTQRKSSSHGYYANGSSGDLSSHSSSRIDLPTEVAPASASATKAPEDTNVHQQGQSTQQSTVSVNMTREATARSVNSIKHHKSTNPFPFIQQDPEFFTRANDMQTISHPVPEQRQFDPETWNQPAVESNNMANVSVHHHPQEALASSNTKSKAPMPASQDINPNYYQYYQTASTAPAPQLQPVQQAQSAQPGQPMQPRQAAQSATRANETYNNQFYQTPASQYAYQTPNIETQAAPVAAQSEKDEVLIDISPAKKHEQRQKLDLTFDQLNLSPPPKDPAKDDETSISQQSVTSSVASSESISMDLRDQSKNRQSGSARVTGTNRANLAKDNVVQKTSSSGVESMAPKRRSLDLKYQEVDFSSSPSPDVSLQRYKTTQQQHQRKPHVSSDTRKSFGRARKSLDLDTLRKENASSNDVSSKRKSFFGKFKG
ncbi:LAMI_0C05446g1_1 [Lachancea mirantina]|uniref:LAMI_0C05446g1_1 n=1 Tax=Lachancea mirantina TaxID=1230905 RepID=A0A1G4J3C7_9SACH|nr:LAMI_0C05446g1_1 [Lachancea mirantina]